MKRPRLEKKHTLALRKRRWLNFGSKKPIVFQPFVYEGFFSKQTYNLVCALIASGDTVDMVVFENGLEMAEVILIRDSESYEDYKRTKKKSLVHKKSTGSAPRR